MPLRAPSACLLLLFACPNPSRAQPQPETRDHILTESTAAISSTLPAEHPPQFRGLGTWIQRPNEFTVCGEMSIPEPNGPNPIWRAFFARRMPDGWHYRPNPTATTHEQMQRCTAEIARLLRPPGGAPPSQEAQSAAFPDLERRCPMDAHLFWTDHAMTCAGHDW